MRILDGGDRRPNYLEVKKKMLGNDHWGEAGASDTKTLAEIQGLGRFAVKDKGELGCGGPHGPLCIWDLFSTLGKPFGNSMTFLLVANPDHPKEVTNGKPPTKKGRRLVESLLQVTFALSRG